MSYHSPLTQRALSLNSPCISNLPTATLNYLINNHTRNRHINDARKLFDENPSTRNVVTWNTLLSGYIKNYQMQNAQNLFHQMPVKDVVSYNTMLSGLNKFKDTEHVYQCYVQMGRAGLRPDEVTLSIMTSAVVGTIFAVLVPQFHGLIIQLAHNFGVFVGSALMKGYTCLGNKVGIESVFDEIIIKDVSSWNSLVLGYMELGCTVEAQKAFDIAPEKNVLSWTSLVNGYVGNKMIDKARTVFNRMGERNEVSWTVMISGYAHNGEIVDALELFLLMLRSDIQPNHYTYSTVLKSCASCSSILMGLQVHSKVLKLGMLDDVILSTSLVDMYAKCGDIELAFAIFKSMRKKNIASWNSVLGGCARHGLGTRALEEFERMTKDGIRPDDITFTNLLSACAHGGLVEEGERHFTSMATKYGIEARMEHYACMVDLFGRAGQLEKAEKLIMGMSFEPDVVVWGALLGACGLHSSLELGEFAAEGIRKLKRDHPAAYSILSKIHGENGVWGSAMDLRKMMRERRAIKQDACSWTQFPSGV